MLIIGIDLSLTGTGLACLEDGILIKTQLVKSELEGKGLLDRMSRIKKILDEISAFINQYYDATKSVETLFVTEGYSFASRAGMAFSLGELGGIIRYWMATTVECDKKCSVLEVPPTQLKKFITGKGNADKNIVIKEIYKNYKVDIDNDNEADAFALAYMGWVYHNIKFKLKGKIVVNAFQTTMMNEMLALESERNVDKAMKESKRKKK